MIDMCNSFYCIDSVHLALAGSSRIADMNCGSVVHIVGWKRNKTCHCCQLIEGL